MVGDGVSTDAARSPSHHLQMQTCLKIFSIRLHSEFGNHLASALAGGHFNLSFHQWGNVAVSRCFEGLRKRSRSLSVGIDACDLQEQKL